MKVLSCISILLFSSYFSLQAQFYGGNGDGSSSAFSSFLMDGNNISYFNGSSGDGFDTKLVSAYLSGEQTIVYIGGMGDGFTMGSRGAFLSVNGPCVEALIKQIDLDPIASGNYEAGSQLLSKGKVRANYNVNFNAGKSIVLQPGFLAENNALFTAIIKNCLTNPVNY